MDDMHVWARDRAWTRGRVAEVPKTPLNVTRLLLLLWPGVSIGQCTNLLLLFRLRCTSESPERERERESDLR